MTTRALLLSAILFLPATADIHVAPTGNDTHPGTGDQPLATLAAARDLARKATNVNVVVHAGTYYLPETLVLDHSDIGTTFLAADGESVTLSGGIKLELDWQPHRDGILQAKAPSGLKLDQLFINGQRVPMARFPNFDPDTRPYGGYSADAFSPQRAANWADPAGGFIHAMHRAHWGGYHYRITGKKADGSVAYEGGWQNNRQMGMHKEHRFVENIREELDAPGEWFHDAKTSTLYHIPAAGTDIRAATVEAVRLRHLVEIRGSQEKPAKNISLHGFTFRHAARTFMDVKEPLLRSDWTIYRGGAVLVDGAEDCAIDSCTFDQPGGNAIFVNNYNRRIAIRGCHIHHCGASAVAFVGDPDSVRNPLFEYGQRQSFADIETTPGPKTDNQPADCTVEDCLIHNVGQVEKQATGVQVSMSRRITIRHCSIYDASRAGINISEGTFGGHLIEGCDVFDTVRETGDHGSFNSWGRDRFWGLKDFPDGKLPELALLDAVETTVIRHNRWRCDHGWDVDLDDGSTNYLIENNLFLNGGLKLREGFHRTVRNNIAVNNSLHPHVWYPDCGDVVTGNIWMGPYRPAKMDKLAKWGKTIDRNLFSTTEADRDKFAKHGCDPNSIVGDPMFTDPANGDFRVKDGSPAFKFGFKNFPMDEFGVRKPVLKKIARTPEISALKQADEPAGSPKAGIRHWLGARIRDIGGDEFSAFGVSKESGGVHLSDVPDGSYAEQAGLKTGDLIQRVDDKPARNIENLFNHFQDAHGGAVELVVIRGQKSTDILVGAYPVGIVESPKTVEGFRDIKLTKSPASFASVTTRPATNNEPVATLQDGKLATNYGPVFGNKVRGGIYKADLGKSRNVASVTTFSHHLNGKRGPQKFALYGSTADTDPGWNIADRKKFVPIAEVNTTGLPLNTYHATKLTMSDDSPLGQFRWLLWVLQPVTPIGENTAVQELEVEVAK